MKKIIKNVLLGLFASSLISTFVSCSTGSDDSSTPTGTPTSSGNLVDLVGEEVTFSITKDALTNTDTKLFLKYNRSAKGASEDLTLKNVKIEVTYNGTPLADYTKDISFPLDEYGDAFDGAPKDGGKITDLAFAKEYKAKIDIFGGNKLKTGDNLKVKVSAKVDSAFKTLAESIVLAVIDTSESANYYNELSDTEYVPAFTADTFTADNNNNGGTSKTFGECKEYEVTVTEDVSAGDFAFVLQADNDGSKDDNGLKITVTDFEMTVKVNDEEPFTVKKAKIEMIPNEYSSPAYEKTDCRFKLSGTKALSTGDKIKIQVKKATVDKEAYADKIIYVFNGDGANNGYYGQYVASSDNYQNPFAAK